jgi:predicted secreted hydrolase
MLRNHDMRTHAASDHVLPGLALAVALLAVSAAAEGVRTPSGNLRPSALADLKPHPSGSKYYNEFWTYHLFLEGNVQAYLNFSRVNLGSFKSPVCGADLAVLGFKGRNYTVAREYEKGNFRFLDSLHQLQVHEDIWFHGSLPDTHRIHFDTRKKGVTYFLDLEFTDILPGMVWGDGMFRMGSESVGIFIHIPRARVKGKLAINKDTLDVTGIGYMDHTFQTDLAPSLVRAGFRYIAQNGATEVGYYLLPDSKYGTSPVGYGLREQGGVMALLKPTGLKAVASGKSMGVKVPTKLEITFQDGSKSVVDRGSDRLAQSTLHEFSGFTRMAIKGFLGGEIFTFKGLGTLNASKSVGYNYFVVD